MAWGVQDGPLRASCEWSERDYGATAPRCGPSLPQCPATSFPPFLMLGATLRRCSPSAPRPPSLFFGSLSASSLPIRALSGRPPTLSTHLFAPTVPPFSFHALSFPRPPPNQPFPWIGSPNGSHPPASEATPYLYRLVDWKERCGEDAASLDANLDPISLYSLSPFHAPCHPDPPLKVDPWS